MNINVYICFVVFRIMVLYSVVGSYRVHGVGDGLLQNFGNHFVITVSCSQKSAACIPVLCIAGHLSCQTSYLFT